jgi:hypothetical protein
MERHLAELAPPSEAPPPRRDEGLPRLMSGIIDRPDRLPTGGSQAGLHSDALQLQIRT